MKNKAKGSAMVLSILLLAFFMALSLNMLYLTQKKAQRAGYKVVGQTAFSGIDESSTLGYYELYLAGELVNIGSLFTTDNAIIVSNDPYFTDPSTYTTDMEITSGTSYAGIALSNYTEYFNSAWNIDSTTSQQYNTTTDQAIISSSTLSSGILTNRSWTNDENKAYRLWMDDIFKYYYSVGGYRLINLEVDGVDIVSDETDSSPTLNLAVGTEYTATAEYEKVIEISLVTSSAIRYTITASESISFTVTGTAIDFASEGVLARDKIDLSTMSEQLTEIIVEKEEID